MLQSFVPLTSLFEGVDISRAKKEDAGAILADKVRSILSDIGIPNGLTELGYNKNDIPAMVAGAMPQVCIINDETWFCAKASLYSIYTER